MTSYHLAETFAVLKPDLGVDSVAVSPDIYQRLDEDYLGFKGHTLISSHSFSESWPTWERHPAGDELVYLLSGEAELVLRTPDGEQSIHLDSPGSYVLVPRNTWHTTRIRNAAEMLFITPGEGTENAEHPQI